MTNKIIEVQNIKVVFPILQNLKMENPHQMML